MKKGMVIFKHRRLLAAITLSLTISAGAGGAECPSPEIFGQVLRYTAAVNDSQALSPELLKYFETSGTNAEPSKLLRLIPECAKKLDAAELACAAPYLEIISEKKPRPIEQLGAGSGEPLGMDMDDDTYRTQYVAHYLDRIPDQLKDPDLYSLFGNPDSANQVVAKLRQNPGWTVTKITDPDFADTVIAHIPGDKSDLLFQFRVNKKGNLEFPNSITILKEEDGKTLVRPKLIYEGLNFESLSDPPGTAPVAKLRATSTDHAWHSKGGYDPGRPSSCFNCHMGGFQYLNPDKDAGEINRKQAYAINNILMGYGLTEQIGMSRNSDPKIGMSLKLGPPLGPVDPPSRTSEFVRSCATPGMSKDGVEKVRRAMNCSSCHDGKRIMENGNPVDMSKLADLYKNGLYELKPIYSMPGDNFMLHRVIQKSGSMPLDDYDLNKDEQDSTYACLIRERNQMFQSMLEPPGCRMFYPDLGSVDGTLKSILKTVAPALSGNSQIRDTNDKGSLDVSSGATAKPGPLPIAVPAN